LQILYTSSHTKTLKKNKPMKWLVHLKKHLRKYKACSYIHLHAFQTYFQLRKNKKTFRFDEFNFFKREILFRAHEDQ
jgi:hypothetical protein